MKRTIVLLLILNVSLFLGTDLLRVAVAGQANAKTDSNIEIIYWQTVEASKNIDMYRAYIKKFPNGNFVDLAKIKIQTLENAASRPAAGRIARPSAPAQVEAPGPLLRNTPTRLELEDVKKMLHKHNFYDYRLNYDGDFKNEFSDNKDGTITDAATGLVWEQVGSYWRNNYRQAQEYIRDLNHRKFGGRSDWRLPTVEELASLIERSPHGPYGLYTDSNFGSKKDGNWLDSCWTSDTYRASHGADHTAWVVNFKKCGVKPAHWYDMIDSNQNDPLYEKNYVRAVCSAK